jgi:hypothetical protein
VVITIPPSLELAVRPTTPRRLEDHMCSCISRDAEAVIEEIAETVAAADAGLDLEPQRAVVGVAVGLDLVGLEVAGQGGDADGSHCSCAPP